MLADLIRGTLTILIITIVAGAIAYVGDRVGHQVGRKRLTLFGMRPRYTSTIVAIGTGMVIALAVTGVAILFSRQVQTALFAMNQLSERISTLQTREHELESKVNTGQLIVPVDALMVPFISVVPKGASIEERMTRIHAFYTQGVAFMNTTYTQQGLKKFTPPPNIEKTLRDLVGDPKVTDASLTNDLLLIITADQNLYRNDEIHFGITTLSDGLRLKKGQPIAQLEIPGGKGANVNLAVNELSQIVSNLARSQLQLPPFLASNVQVVQSLPNPPEMQAQLKNGKGSFVLSAFAAEDVYAHTGGIPIVITLAQAR